MITPKIKKEVDRITTKYATCDVFALCDALDIVVVKKQLPTRIKGFYHLFENIQIIYLNTAYSGDVQRQTCMHELGHAVLHRDFNAICLKTYTNISVGRYEREAAVFMLALLLKTDGFSPENGMTDAKRLSELTALDENDVCDLLRGEFTGQIGAGE